MSDFIDDHKCVTHHYACDCRERHFGQLQDKNKELEIRLWAYEEDSAELLEKHGVDPDDKVDREVLKRMLNYVIGLNTRLKIELENYTANWDALSKDALKFEVNNKELRELLRYWFDLPTKGRGDNHGQKITDTLQVLKGE